MPEAHAGMMVTPSVRLVRPLGEGGMGAVWVADHLALRTQVVVKFIATELKSSKEAVERFSREAAAAAQVKSPHVVQTFDHGLSEDGVPYIVMELLEGQDLGKFLDAHGKLSPELALEIVGQLARALDKAHEKGIIHRDIKPGNIFLCDQGKGEIFVKLLDFGIAKGVDVPIVDSNTKTGSMIGSPFYMSPEQILGSKGVDHRSDLWSVGVVAFEAITGHKPFDAETMGGLAIKIHSEPLPFPTTLLPELPPAVDAWFQRACSRKVEERFTSAKELAESLAAALGGVMPRSISGGEAPPRISTGEAVQSRRSSQNAFAATDAGVVRSTGPTSTRSRVLMLLGIVVVGAPASFFAIRALRAPSAGSGPGQALVQHEPSAATTPPSAPSATSTTLPPTSPPAPTILAATPPPPSATPAPTPTHVVTSGRHHPKDPQAGAAVSATVASPASAPSPATSTKPVASGHDIF